MRKILVVALLIVFALTLTSCDDIDIGQLWAYFDYCGDRAPTTGNSICGMWWDLGTGQMTGDEAHAILSTTATAQSMPTATTTPIPPPVHRPVKVIFETPTAIYQNSPIYPTATPTPFGGVYVPDMEDYEGLLDWYFNQ